MPKKKQVFEPENLESIRSAISGLIVEPPETIEPVVYSVDLLSRHDPYYPMVQGEATSRLAMTATRNMAINPITGDAVIEDEGFRAFFEGYDGLKIGLTVGAQKLLSTAALYLTQNNHYRPEESARIETEVQIPLISYARLLGYPVDERETATPEEAEKEKRRIKNLMKDVRGKINDQLDVLYSLSLSWSEKKGRVSDYQDVRLLQRKGVKRGMISIQFSDDIARYLLCSYVMQYPEALLSIDERSPRAYRVGYKLAYHSSVRRNIERGTADMKCLRAAQHALQRGEDVLIFPEGTRIRSREIKPEVHGGFALIAQMGKAPVNPLAICGWSDITPPGKKIMRPKKCWIRAGKAVSLSDAPAGLKRTERLEWFESEAMNRVYAMRDELCAAHPGRF